MGNLWSPSWKGKLERGEPLPLDLQLTEEVLQKMGVAQGKVKIVLGKLQQSGRETWGTLLLLLKEDEERVRSELGDEKSAKVMWNFFKDYNAKNRGALFPPPSELLNPIFPQPPAALDAVPHSIPSWKQKLELGEPLPLSLKLSEELLEEMGVATRKVKTVLENLQQRARETWATMLVLMEEGEERVRSEVGDELSAQVMWRFFKGSSAKGGGQVAFPSRDVTESVLNSLLQDLDRFPSLEHLEGMLRRPMAALIPVPTRIAKALFEKIIGDKISETFQGTIGCVRAADTDYTTLEFICHHLLEREFAAMLLHGSENQLHQVYDPFFQRLLKLLLKSRDVAFVIDRDTTKALGSITTTNPGTKRSSSECNLSSDSIKKRSKVCSSETAPSADSNETNEGGSPESSLLLSIKNVLILHGEEKRHSVPMEKAEADLIRKTVWCPALMGRLPYMLAYVACGAKIRLYAMHPLPSSYRVTLTRLGRELDLTKISDALELVGYMIQIARVLISANAGIVARDVPPIGEVWKRASDAYCKITIHETYVEKCLLENDGGRIQWDGPGGLEELYNLIDAGLITGTIRLKDVIRSRSRKQNKEIAITLLLKPLGYPVVPLLHELENFLRDVLAALHSMHENGWVHRDVKLRNVVKRTDGHWMLIDLEYAAKLDDAKSADWPWFDRPEYPMPERDNDEERWRPEHDVKQVAIMLDQLGYFARHPHQVDIRKVLMEAETADVMRQLEPFLTFS